MGALGRADRVSLQILNHLQDCGKDLRDMDRCYLPENDLKRKTAVGLSMISAYALTPGLRRTIDGLLDHVRPAQSHRLRLCRVRVRDKRLKVETAMIVALAKAPRQNGCVKGDPLATRVKLSKAGFCA